MRSVIGLDQLGWLPKFTLAVALVAWATTMLGLIMHGVARTQSAGAHSAG